MHDRLNQALNWLFGAGRVTKTEIEAESKDVICTIEVETGEVAERQYLGTHAAILMRPAPPTSDGAMGVLVMRWGDARKPFMTDEQRWQVDVAEGEVVVRAFGDNASRIRLKPNGDVVIDASGQILHGGDTAAKALALAEEISAKLDTIQAKYDVHTHPFVATGAASPTSAPTPSGLLGPGFGDGIASTKVMTTE